MRSTLYKSSFLLWLMMLCYEDEEEERGRGACKGRKGRGWRVLMGREAGRGGGNVDVLLFLVQVNSKRKERGKMKRNEKKRVSDYTKFHTLFYLVCKCFQQQILNKMYMKGLRKGIKKKAIYNFERGDGNEDKKIRQKTIIPLLLNE